MEPSPKDLIEKIVRRIVEVAHPIKVILFGSYALGTPHQDSDIDVLVIEKHVGSRFKEMLRLRRALRGILVPMDILVISEAGFMKRSKIPSTVYYWADQEGKVVYNSAA